MSRLWLVSDDARLLSQIPANRRLGFDRAALQVMPMDPEATFVQLRQCMAEAEGLGALVVDMGWITGHLQGVTGLESWGGVADRLAAEFGLPIVSLYNQDLTIEEQLQTALRAHRQFVAPSGIHANPYWIPVNLLESAPLDEQLSFMLARVVPDYEGLSARRQQGQMFARGPRRHGCTHRVPIWAVRLGPRAGMCIALAV
jgi:hypothetical protein